MGFVLGVYRNGLVETRSLVQNQGDCLLMKSLLCMFFERSKEFFFSLLFSGPRLNIQGMKFYKTAAL